MGATTLRMAISFRSHPNRLHILDLNQTLPSSHLLEFVSALSDGVTAPNLRTNTLNFSFVQNFFRQVLKTLKQHLRLRFWITSELMR